MDMLEGGIGMLGNQFGDATFKVAFLEIRLWLSHLHRNFGRFIATPFADRQQQAQQVLTKVAGKMRDHPQIE